MHTCPSLVGAATTAVVRTTKSRWYGSLIMAVMLTVAGTAVLFGFPDSSSAQSTGPSMQPGGSPPERIIEGRLEILYIDPQPGHGRPRTEHRIRKDDGTVELLSVDPELHGRLVKASGQRVKVKAKDATVVEVQSTTAQAAFPPGTLKAINVLCYVPDKPIPAAGPEFFQSLTGATYPGTQDAWREQSYG